MCVHTGVTGTPGLPCAGTAWTPRVSQPLALSTRPVALRRARCACGPGSCWLVCAQAACEWAEHTPLHTHMHTGTHSQAVPQLLRVTRRPQGPQALLQGGHCQDKRDRYKEQRSSARRCPDARVRALLLGAQRRGGQDLGDHRSDRVPARPRRQGCAVPGAPRGPSTAHTHHSYPQHSPQGTPPQLFWDWPQALQSGRGVSPLPVSAFTDLTSLRAQVQTVTITHKVQQVPSPRPQACGS